MELNLNYVHNENMGYGRLGVKLAEALAAKGVTVFDHLPGPERPLTATDIGIEDRHAGLANAAVWVSTPPQANGWWSTQTPSIFTMWETKSIPEDFRAKLHHFETVLVPSEQNIELFSRYHRDVRLVLLGVDPTEWHFVERRPPGAFFDFLIGGSGERKGTDIAFEAFKAAFPKATTSGPIPRLLMKNPRNEEFAFDGRVTVIGGKLTAEDEQALYAHAHCYLQPSRGEGFGLQPLQALAQGLPTILTDAHGHEAFAHLGYGIGTTNAKAAYFLYGDGGDWWEPNLDELIDQMRWVYDNWDEAAEKAKVAAGVIARDFTWANTADQFLEHIDCTMPYVGGGEWVTPTEAKFRIRLNETRIFDIAGRRLRFEAGVDYWDLADVKRIAFEAGYLDPDCIEDDGGLLDSQLVEAGVRSAEVPWPNGDPDLTAWHAGA